MSLYQQPSWAVFALPWALALELMNSMDSILSDPLCQQLMHWPASIFKHTETSFCCSGFIRIICHSSLLVPPVKARSNSIVQKDNFLETSFRFMIHPYPLPLSIIAILLFSLLQRTLVTNMAVWTQFHPFPWLFLTNQDQSLSWLPREAMLLVIYSAIFEAYHQCESYFALNSKGSAH